MATIGYETWAVDLAEVGAVYPFQGLGLEFPMFLVGIAFWLGWHLLQRRIEQDQFKEAMQSADPALKQKAIERY